MLTFAREHLFKPDRFMTSQHVTERRQGELTFSSLSTIAPNKSEIVWIISHIELTRGTSLLGLEGTHLVLTCK